MPEQHHEPKPPEDVFRTYAAGVLGIPPEDVTEQQRRFARAALFGVLNTLECNL